MSNASLELGGGKWGTKDGNLLGYASSTSSSKFVPREFTFTRGSDIAATRVNSSGVIEKYRENLLLQSNQFDTSPWVSSSVTLTSGQLGYDGSTDAWLLEATGTSSTRVQQTISSDSVQTISVYAKKGTSDYFQIRLTGSTTAFAFFDLANGTLGTLSNQVDASITSVGNGWYRCSLVRTGAATSARIYVTGNNTTSVSVGDNIYIQDAQLEKGLVATSYLESGATTATSGVADNEPRINYTGGKASLLLEPSRTNEIAQSEYFDSWTKIGSPTITNNYGISPEGVRNSTRFEAISDRITYDLVTTNANETFSIYMKGSGTLHMQIGDDNFYPSVTSEWVRYEFTTTQVGNRNVQIRGNGSAADVELYGAQYERNSYPTSYIPTYGTSVTRNADGFQKTGASSVIGQTEGTLYIEAIFKEEGNLSQWFSLTDGTANNWVFIGKDNDDIRGYIRANNIVAFTNQTFQITNNTVVKAALSYKSGSISLYINGSLIASSTNSFSFNQPLDTIRSATYNTEITREKVNFDKILVFKNALTNAECITLTT